MKIVQTVQYQVQVFPNSRKHQFPRLYGYESVLGFCFHLLAEMHLILQEVSKSKHESDQLILIHCYIIN